MTDTAPVPVTFEVGGQIFAGREERLSLYGHVTFGDVRFMIQLSEVKPQYRGFKAGTPFADVMYDYASKDYGVRLG